MKRAALRFSTEIRNVLTHIMNYNIAWFIGPLGQIAFLPQATALEFVFNWAETTSFRQSWDDFGLNPSVIVVFIYAKMNWTKEEMCQVQKQILKPSQMWKHS